MRQQDTIFSNKHPVEMYLLALIELCQRFAYWGIANLLVLFLVKHFSYSTPHATHLFGTYTGLAFLVPILGGIIADKWNYKSPILLGMSLTATGCLLLATLCHSLILPALILIGLGGGIFSPSIYSLLGRLYAHKQPIREGGFSIYYASVNIGVFLAMIILGYLQTVNWTYVFVLSALVQLLGFIPYFIVVKRLKKSEARSPHVPAKKEHPHGTNLKRREKDRIIVILIMISISILFWMAYSQAGSSMTLFALKYTDRQLGGFQIPTPWFTSAHTFFLILFAFPLARLYLFLRRIHSSASPPMKTALSLFFMGLCFLVMQRAALHIPLGAGGGAVSPHYLISAFALMAVAELFLAPIGLSLITNLSPNRHRGLLTGVWFTCIGVGFYSGGYLAGLMAQIHLSSFFDIFVFTSFIPAFILVLFSKKLDTMRHIDSL